MTEQDDKQPTGDDLAKRRVACFIGYLHPFRIVEADTLEPWACTIEQVNGRSWNYAALHEMAPSRSHQFLS